MREGKVALSKLAKIVKQPRDQQFELLKKARAENSKPKKHSKKAKASKNKEADPVEEMSKTIYEAKKITGQYYRAFKQTQDDLSRGSLKVKVAITSIAFAA
jgi:hypothetical protein